MNSSVIGHIEIREKLLNLIVKDKLAHSNLFSGPRGIGKNLVALELAKFSLCENKIEKGMQSCNECSSCKLFDSGNHPDFYIFDCQKDENKDNQGLSAEQTRVFLNSINLAPFRGGKRFVIFNNADSLSSVVSNLLLKTLEEPRKDSFFILIASNPSRLPLPVVSRCQNWRFDFLDPKDIKQIISQKAEAHEIEDLTEICDGSLEEIESIRERLKENNKIKNSLHKIASGDSLEALNFSTLLAKDKTNISINLRIVRIFLKKFLYEEKNAETKLAFAKSLENIIVAERMIKERNFAPLALFNITFLGLCRKIELTAGSLSEIVV